MESAKEMFEKLGFILKRSNDEVMTYDLKEEMTICDREYIEFYPMTGNFEVNYKFIKYDYKEVFKAIQQQIKELNWDE